MTEEPATVWERRSRGERGPAPERNRDQITAAAVALADEGGLPAVSMRQVAARLHTGPSSLYRYITTRDELLDLMVDSLAARIDLTVPLSGDPVQDLTDLALRSRAVHLDHPWLSDLAPEPSRIGPRGADLVEYALRALAPTTLSQQARLETVGLLNGLVLLFTRTEIARRTSPTDHQAAHAAYLTRTAAQGRHPFLAAALAATEPAEEPGALFPRMMRDVLTALLR
ncbi:TetR/AcrR family transcriptional regulator [Nocardiopsis sp. NPDC058631]|uniref:TetR/AcrR family transcriptional regulator n=1 Tax=Nocardiopsis sp. NPDC058631 TaxID=3346566 RepID=UPI00365B3264